MDSERHSSLRCQVSVVDLVVSEILAVTSSMRKNSRWASMSSGPIMSSVSAGQLGLQMGLRAGANGNYAGPNGGSQGNMEINLITGFTTLRAQLDTMEKKDKYDALNILTPFLEVIKSGETTGPITAMALASVERFLTYGLISTTSPNIIDAIEALSSACTQCKFEPSDSVSDELVLLRILQVLRILICGDLGAFLTDEVVCAMMETSLSMCYQMRLSEMLRRSAEITMTIMVHSVFQRLKSVDPQGWLPNENSLVEAQNTLNEKDDRVIMKMSRLRNGTVDAEADKRKEHEQPHHRENGESPQENGELKQSQGVENQLKIDKDHPKVEARNSDKDTSFTPYGLPAIRELLRVLISLSDPHDHQHTDTMRLMALRIVNVALETSGKTMGLYFPLRQLVVDDLCRHLFQLARSENTLILSSALRTISTLFHTFRTHLRLQQELFLSFLIRRISPSLLLDASGNGESIRRTDSPASTTSRSSTPVPRKSDLPPVSGEVRILLVECLSQLAKSPSFMIDLWVNYDCDVHCSDLFDEMLRFLSKNSFPEFNGQPFSSFNMLCLDAMLCFISNMASRLDRLGDVDETDLVKYPTPEALLNLKSRKKLLLEAAAKFNAKPKAGIEFLEKNNIIQPQTGPDGPRSLARFLKITPRIDKRLLGDYLSRPQNIAVLREFINLINFNGKRVDEGLRELFEAFRLPGEAQQIARIIETFAEKFHAAAGSDVVKTQDACYVLAYSVVMLNTDQHNPQVRKRMKIDEYMRNLRGVNDGQDFPVEYLQAVYDAISKREIVMPEEHDGQLGFNYAWKELLRRSESVGMFVVCNTHKYDRDIFFSSWKSILQTVNQAFLLFQDDSMLQRTIASFHQCALLAANYHLHEVFDQIISSLADITGLLSPRFASTSANYPQVDVDGQSVVISDLSIEFGRNYKGQLAAVVLFKVVNEYASIIRQSWSHILQILHNWFLHSLLPDSLLQVEDFLAGTLTIPLKPKAADIPKQDRGRESGLLSTLSSYLLSPYSGSSDNLRADPMPEEKESTMCAIDCISACHVEELYAELKVMDVRSLQLFIEKAKKLADDHTLEKLKEKRQRTGMSNGPLKAALPYDPSAIFYLELMVGALQQRKECIEEFWPSVLDHISGVLNNAESFSVLCVERNVVALLRLCNLIIDKPSLLDQVFVSLDMVQSLPLPVMNNVAEQLMAGFASLMKSLPKYVTTPTEWQMILVILSRTAQHPSASKYSIEISKSIMNGEYGTQVIDDTFGPCIDLLSAFASVGSSTDAQLNNGVNDNQRRPAKIGSEYAQRAMESLELICKLASRIKIMKDTPTWTKYWLPVFNALRRQVVNPYREIRNHALTDLQRTLLFIQLDNGTDVGPSVILEQVLFPLLDELLKPEVFQLDPLGMDETRMKSSALLCKVFVHFLIHIQEWDGMVDLWAKILQYLDRFMHSGKRDNLYESVPESLKNVLLVMSSSGYLVDPAVIEKQGQLITELQTTLWKVTWDKLDVLLPNIKDELFPPMIDTPAENPVQKEAVSAASVPVEEPIDTPQ